MGQPLKSLRELAPPKAVVATPLRQRTLDSRDDLIWLDQIFWRCLINLPLASLSRLRSVSSSWEQKLMHYVRSGYTHFDLTEEIKALRIWDPVRGSLTMIEHPVLPERCRVMIKSMLQFVLTHCTRLKAVKIEGCIRWFPRKLDKLHQCTTNLLVADLRLGVGWRYVSQASLSRWVTSKWAGLQTLTLLIEAGSLPGWVAAWISTIKATCKSLHYANLAVWATDTPTMAACAELLTSWLQLPSMVSVRMELAIPDLAEHPLVVTAPIENLAVGKCQLSRNVNLYWSEYLTRLLPALPHLKILMLSGIDIQPSLATTICSRCTTLEALSTDMCKGEQMVVRFLAEKDADGAVKWLPNLKFLQLQKTFFQCRLMRGFHAVQQRSGLEIGYVSFGDCFNDLCRMWDWEESQANR